MQRSGGRVDAIECKINPDRLDPEPLRVFRATYPVGSNYLICPVADPPTDRRYGGLVMCVTTVL